MLFGWQIAFALELLVLLLGFGLWFKAAKAEAGPKKLGRIAAIVVIILAVLLAACTLSKAFLAYKDIKDARVGAVDCTGTCPDCSLGSGPGAPASPCPPGVSCPSLGGSNAGAPGTEPCGRATPCGTCLEQAKTPSPAPAGKK